MKTQLQFLLVTIMLSATCLISAQGGINQNFASLGNWYVDDKPNGTSSVSGGHLIVTMGDQGNGKYRADLKNDNATYTINSTTDKIIAVKFIGDKPATGAFKVELRNETAAAWMNNGGGKYNPAGSITTTEGNLIYYFDFSGDANYTTGDISISRIGFTLADVVDPTNYTIDWVATFADLAALEAYKDFKDDGASDTEGTLNIDTNTLVTSLFNVYPNPINSSSFNLEVNDLNTNNNNIEVYNLLGSKILSKKIKKNKTEIFHNLNAGIYIVKVGEISKKIIVK